MNRLAWLSLAVLAPLALGWVALSLPPAPLPALAAAPPGGPETVPLPAGLPAPVERFYRQEYGERVPVVRTAVITGRGWMRLFGLRVPIRFRYTHEAGRNLRQDIDLCLFGLPVTRAHELYLDGRGWAKTPGGIEAGPGFDQGSVVSLWAEALTWFPAVLATDPRVHWTGLDDQTALARVPFGAGTQALVVRFDPASGKIQHIEAMKYNTATRRPMLWIDGIWAHEGRPWIQMNVEDLTINAPVADYLRSVPGAPAPAGKVQPG